MKKDLFKNLLIDLYKAYNPDYLKYVDDLVEKYSRMELSAVDMIFTKYNHKSKPHFDPIRDTQEYKLSLVKEYSEGKRTLENLHETIKLETPKEEKPNTELQDKLNLEIAGKAEEIKKIGEHIDSQLSSKLKTADEILRDKEKKIEELYDKLKEFENSSIERGKLQGYSNVDIRIISNYTDSELILPKKEILAGLGIGTRIIVQDKSGKMIGLEIKDIIYDTVSSLDDRTILEITVDK